VLDSTALAARLTERLAAELMGQAPATLTADGQAWHLDGINERFRFCRYEAGQRFNIHQDGVHHRSAGHRSHLSFLVYLDDGAAFAGGDTVFYTQGPGAQADGHGPQELGRVRPQAGSLLLFDHDIWHAGDEVTAGVKHVLRSDLLYRSAAAQELPADESKHRGYVWTLASLADGMLASGGRDATIRIRDAGGRPLRYLRGHTQSVLGLAPLPGQRLASVSRDRTLRIWNWSTGVCETTVAAHDAAVLDVITLADGRLASGAADGLVKLWNQDGSAAGSLAGHAGWVWQMAALDKGGIASASEDGTVRTWDAAAMRCSAVLAGDEALRTLLVLDGEIWTGDIAGRVARWRLSDGRWTRTAQFQAHAAAVRRLRRIGDGRVASCGEDCALRVWNADSGAQVFEAWHENFVTDALRCGDALFSSAYDGRIRGHAGWLPRFRQRESGRSLHAANAPSSTIR